MLQVISHSAGYKTFLAIASETASLGGLLVEWKGNLRRTSFSLDGSVRGVDAMQFFQLRRNFSRSDLATRKHETQETVQV